MMIFVTGDTHGEFNRFSSQRFPEGRDLTRSDYVIIAGDFGGVWSNSPEEQYWLDWLDDKPWTTLFVDGNHENFSRLAQLPVVDFCGGHAHEVRPGVLHLMRGEVFDIPSDSRGTPTKRFFVMGGARSHDIDDGILEPTETDRIRRWAKRRKRFRINGVSWWPEEMPSGEEISKASFALDKINYGCDYIVTHSAPSALLPFLAVLPEPDELTNFLEGVAVATRFERWYFGHYHDDKIIWGKFRCIYEDIERIE